MKEEDPVVDSARAVIFRSLSAGHPPIGVVAGAVKMSVRTFQRRLAASGRRYKKLIDEVRLAEAKRAFAASGLSLKAIAFRLGFAEQANFTRAFRRWTGQSPSAYRKRHKIHRSDEAATSHPRGGTMAPQN
jgi:AraC-like DNA-binding protein